MWRHVLLTAAKRQYCKKVLSYAPIAYWPQWEPSGNVAHCLVNPAQNGTYTGVTLGQPGIGDGRTCPFYDGATDYTDVETAALKATANGTEGSILVWPRVFDAADWTDGNHRAILALQVSASHNVYIRKTTTNNELQWRYEANDVVNSVSQAGYTTTGPMCLGLTWDKIADEMRAFFGGLQVGATQNGLGLWAGELNDAVIGAINNTPTWLWHGYLAHAALWDHALPPAVMEDLAHPT